MKKIIAVLFYLSTWVVWAQTSTVNLTSEKQYIRGFGGINHPEWAGDLTAAQRTTAFGNGSGEMGLTVLRIFINDDKNQWNKTLATALRAQQLGATIFATPWNPPASMCETITRNNRQEKRLKPSSYNDYAQHLIDFNNYMKANGVNLYAMSFANEPDWGFDWTWYSADEVYNFTKNVAGKLRVNGVKVITAESFSYNKNYYNQILNDPTALANIDIIGCHLYGSDANSPVSVFNYPLADSKAPAKERWMTEHYTNSDANSSDLWPDANDVSYEIYRCMVEGQMSVYTWWYIRRQYGPMNENGTISKRGYCMAQYSKFIRPGYVRVDATKNPTTDVYVSAYKKGDDVVLVAINRSTSSKTITISVPGTRVTTWEKYVTSGSKSLAKEANINSTTGSFQITLDPQSTTSFVGTAPTGNPTVTLTSPSNNTNFNAPATVTLSAIASDANGTVSTVQFYNGTTLLSTATNSPYSFTWSNVAPGTYTITAVATDNSGNKTTSAPATITVVPLATIASVGSTTFCTGGSVVLNANTGTGYSYVWKNGTTIITGVTNSSYTAIQPGNYTVTVTAGGQSATSTAKTITVNTLPAAAITTTTPTTFCQGGSITLNANTGTGFTYQWFNGTNAVGTGNSSLSLYVSSGSFTVKVTDGNGCSSTSAPVNVTINPTPAAPAVSAVQTYCQNATAAQLTATGSNLKWYADNTTTTVLSAAPTPSTTTVGTTNYFVSQTTNGCESSKAQIAVTVNALPTAMITAGSATTFCAGGSVTLTASTGTAYVWKNGSNQIGTAQSYSATTAGSYTVEITNANGCKATSAATVVTVNASPNAPAVTTPVMYCKNATAGQLTATGSNLKWYADNTTTTVLSAAPTPSTTTVGITSYFVSQTTNGCESTRAQITVTVNALPTATITTTTPTTFCAGGSVTLNASTGSSYIWKNGGSQVGTGSTYSAATTGSYTVEVTNANGCKATSAATAVTVNTAPNAPAVTTPVTYCQNEAAAQLTATGSNLRWYADNTTATALSIAPTPSTAAVGTTSYFVSQTTNGCESTRAQIVVTVNALPTATITANGSTLIPQGGSVVLTASAGSSYIWYKGGAQVGTGQSYTATAAGSYTVEVTNSNNCKATSLATDVNSASNQPSQITITSPTANTTVQGTITITANVTDPDGSIVLVEYLDGNDVIGTSTSAPYSFDWTNPGEGTHVITVRVTDSNGGITTSAPVTITSSATTTGVQLSNTLHGNVYPNPSNRIVFIDSDTDLSGASFMLVDVLGNEHYIGYTATGLGAQVDVSNLSDGAYILIIKKDNSVLRKKITVIR